MATLHDAKNREAIKARLRLVTADSLRKWGVMTVDQMMWHLAEGVRWYFREMDATGIKAPFPMPKPMMRFMVLNLPWPKGAPTMRPMLASGKYELEAERGRCLALMDEFAARPLDGEWLEHPLLGKMSGEQCSRLQAKHFDHHLRQFGV